MKAFLLACGGMAVISLGCGLAIWLAVLAVILAGTL